MGGGGLLPGNYNVILPEKRTQSEKKLRNRNENPPRGRANAARPANMRTENPVTNSTTRVREVHRRKKEADAWLMA
jgi:hypothetical protein